MTSNSSRRSLTGFDDDVADVASVVPVTDCSKQRFKQACNVDVPKPPPCAPPPGLVAMCSSPPSSPKAVALTLNSPRAVPILSSLRDMPPPRKSPSPTTKGSFSYHNSGGSSSHEEPFVNAKTKCEECSWNQTEFERGKYRVEMERLYPGRVLPIVVGNNEYAIPDSPTLGMVSPPHTPTLAPIQPFLPPIPAVSGGDPLVAALDVDPCEWDVTEAADIAALLREEEEEEEEDDLWQELLGPITPIIKIDESSEAVVKGIQNASLNRLVEALTPASGAPDQLFSDTFFLTYSRFVSTSSLLRKLCHRYCVPSRSEQVAYASTIFSLAPSTPHKRTPNFTKNSTHARGASPTGALSPTGSRAARLRRRACTFQNLHADDDSSSDNESSTRVAPTPLADEGFLGEGGQISPVEKHIIQLGVLQAVTRIIASNPPDLAPQDSRLVSVLARDALIRGFRAPVRALLEAGSKQEMALSYQLHDLVTEPLRALTLPVRFHELNTSTLKRLAEQFCLLDFELYSRIDPHELLGNLESPLAQSRGSTSGLAAIVKRFNAVSLWSTSLLLNLSATGNSSASGGPTSQQQSPSKQQSLQQSSTNESRMLAAEMLLRLAKLLRDANDFQGMHAIITGMSKSCVASTVEAAFAKHQEYKTYFQRFQSLMSDGKWLTLMQNCQPPCIPFVGKYQGDLVRIDASMPDHSDPEKRCVNFAKCSLIHRTINEMLRGRASPYTYTVEPSLRFYALTLPESFTEAEIDGL